jgi:hypothetical protein
MDTSSNAVEADGDRGRHGAFAFPVVNWLPGHLIDLERQRPPPLPDHFLAQATSHRARSKAFIRTVKLFAGLTGRDPHELLKLFRLMKVD